MQVDRRVLQGLLKPYSRRRPCVYIRCPSSNQDKYTKFRGQCVQCRYFLLSRRCRYLRPGPRIEWFYVVDQVQSSAGSALGVISRRSSPVVLTETAAVVSLSIPHLWLLSWVMIWVSPTVWTLTVRRELLSWIRTCVACCDLMFG